MKKAFIALIVLGIVSAGAVAYAHMWGGGSGWGYGPGMMWGGGDYDEKALDETADLRKQLNDKVFEYREAFRKGDEKRVEELETEIEGIQKQLYEKLGVTGKSGKGDQHRKGYGFRKGYGPRGGYSPGWGCGGPGWGYAPRGGYGGPGWGYGGPGWGYGPGGCR